MSQAPKFCFGYLGHGFLDKMEGFLFQACWDEQLEKKTGAPQSYYVAEVAPFRLNVVEMTGVLSLEI